MNDKKSRVIGLRIVGSILFLLGTALVWAGSGLSNFLTMVFGFITFGFGFVCLVGADPIISAIIAKQEGNQNLPKQKTSETEDLAKELQNLVDMKDKGLIDETEFKKLKKKLISK